MKSGSWIVVSKATGKAVLETFERSTADAINRDRYDVIPAYEYLVALNKQIKKEQT